MATVTDTGHLARLERALSVEDAVGHGLTRGAQGIVDEARFNVNDGAISGPGHIPGAPSSYAKSDTHEYEQSLSVGEVIEVADTIYQTAGSHGVPYGIMLELGTSKMLPRPNLQLATRAKRNEVAPAIADEMRKARNGT